jgi:hypothetical protein
MTTMALEQISDFWCWKFDALWGLDFSGTWILVTHGVVITQCSIRVALSSVSSYFLWWNTSANCLGRLVSQLVGSISGAERLLSLFGLLSW